MTVQMRFEFAPQDRISSLERWAPRFFAEVVGHDYWDCLVTDESDLHDFACMVSDGRGVEVAAMLDRMDKHYFVESRSVGSTRVVDLLEYLVRSGVTG